MFQVSEMNRRKSVITACAPSFNVRSLAWFFSLSLVAAVVIETTLQLSSCFFFLSLFPSFSLYLCLPVFVCIAVTGSRSRPPLHSSHSAGANSLSRRLYKSSSAPYHTGRSSFYCPFLLLTVASPYPPQKGMSSLYCLSIYLFIYHNSLPSPIL